MDNVTPQLRAAADAVDRAISGLPASALGDTNRPEGLKMAWVELVDRMALGPAPALRECPNCKHHGMRLATRCGYCWHKLPALDGVS